MVNIHVNDNNNQIRINVPGINNTVSTQSTNPNNNVSSTIGNETFYNGLAKEWAISPELVQGEDYSAKHYAGQAANSASEAASAVEGFTTTVTEATQQAISTLETTKTTIITELGEEKTSIISDIDNEGTTQISDITSTATTCITDIQSEGSTQVTSVTTTGENYITNIQTEGSTQVTNITTTATTYITTMTTLKDDTQGYATAAGLSATTAATSEDNAEIWAEGTDAQVQALGGVHSAKGWAEESATGQINVNWAESDPTSKAYIFNKPTKLSDFTNDSGFISSITPSDVTTALGYTPYNASNPSGYITSSDLPTVNNGTLTIQKNGTTIGTFTANQSGNSTVNIEADTVLTDDITVSKNSNDELQAIGVIDDNTGNAIKTWTGTKAQYDAIVTKDATTLYNITDDTDVTLALLELLFPVGAVYFGTMSVCPLQTLGVGTWQALPPDKVIQIAGTRGAVGTTINESLPNIKGTASFSGVIKTSSTSPSTANFKTVGAMYATGQNLNDTNGRTTDNSWFGSAVVGIDASRSSSTYQDNAPVQQDAYLLRGWERIS